MPATGRKETITNLRRKVLRLEAKNARLQAEAEMYQMMAHDLAAPTIVAEIKRKFPRIAKEWETHP
jgi:hypothetical protein